MILLGMQVLSSVVQCHSQDKISIQRQADERRRYLIQHRCQRLGVDRGRYRQPKAWHCVPAIVVKRASTMINLIMPKQDNGHFMA